MARGWYVLHTYTGYENKIEKTIRIMMADGELGDSLHDIKVPSEQVVEIKDGKKKISTKKFLPGYILLEMDLPDIGWKTPCSAIRRINGVTGFVGSSSGMKPQPISQEEARAILQKTGEIKGEKAMTPKQSFSVGESVRIVDGPFDSFTGQVEEVNLEKAKLRV
ncbi:MAG: transcription termination/antitermination factor NusG, partial [Spirochaetales bacterium]